MKRNLVGLLGMIVLVGMGEHMAERFLPLYLQQLEIGRASCRERVFRDVERVVVWGLFRKN